MVTGPIILSEERRAEVRVLESQACYLTAV